MMLALVFVILLALIQSESKKFNVESSFQRKLRENDYSIYTLSQNENANANAIDLEREQLYEAYNLLHTLAQDFHKPFDAPAVIVVGHQTSGKSALIEAIMGFQFNQVGGGTKTRRPIALRMQYNPNCVTPLCFLTLENGKEEQRSLQDIQAYIEAENKRLEKDPSRSFDPREINIRMEYKYCPNMIVIDTPGMIHPPKGRHLTPQQRALAQAAREAEALVLSKIRCQDYIILCVEDTTDWKHSTTRNVVMQADPQLQRTVLVSTKLDTKLPQFSESEDLDDFLRAPLIHQLFSQMLGGPFFTSVPSGRVGTSKEFESNEEFVDSVRYAERNDRGTVVSKMGAVTARAPLQHVGVSRLRTFLEARVEDCYRRNVAKIVPLLQSEMRMTEAKLAATEAELNALSLERLRQAANDYRELFSKELANTIQGTVRASPEEWGETLETEQLRGGSFLTSQQQQQPQHGSPSFDQRNSAITKKRPTRAVHLLEEQAEYDPHRDATASSSSVAASALSMTGAMSSQDWQKIAIAHVAHAQAKLFGGAQYHRAMKEFALAVRHLRSPIVTEDEIANAAGMGDTHNGVNFMRAACVIAMEKARLSFDPALEALAQRSEHIMKRLFPIVQHLVRTSNGGGSSSSSSSSTLHVQVRPFQDIIRRIYDRFIEETLRECVLRCKDDLSGMTDYVTFDVEERGGSLGSGAGSTIYSALPTPRRVAEIWQMAVDRRQQNQVGASSGRLLNPADTALGFGEVMEGGGSLGVDDDDADEEEDGWTGDVGNDNDDEDDDDVDVAIFGNAKRSSSSPKSRRSNAILDKVMEEWNRANGANGRRSSRRNMNPLDKRKKPLAKKRVAMAKVTRPTGSVHSRMPAPTPVNQQLVAMPAAVEEDAMLSDYYRVVQLTEEMVSGSSATRTSALVTAIVEYIVSAWRMYFARTTAMKFNSFFLMSLIKRFPNYLREELDKVYRGEMSEVFDMTEARRELTVRREHLLAEVEANGRLQQRFDAIAQQLRKSGNVGGGGGGSAEKKHGDRSSIVSSSSGISSGIGGSSSSYGGDAMDIQQDELDDLFDVEPMTPPSGRRRRVFPSSPGSKARDILRRDEKAAGEYSAANIDVNAVSRAADTAQEHTKDTPRKKAPDDSSHYHNERHENQESDPGLFDS
jgi:uncharacterized membrane protein YgcG